MKAVKKERDPRVSVKTVKAALTKAQMIQEIQKTEAALFLELKQAAYDFGYDDAFTGRRRAAYSAVYTLMKSLGIEPDFQLADNQKAMEVMLATSKKKMA